MIVIGWDIGGAHLKAARIEDGRVTAAIIVACPLWKGIERLDDAISAARGSLGDASLHAVTMTGELSDIFADRAQGVSQICSAIGASLNGEILVSCGTEGWLSLDVAPSRSQAVASANWHASAAILARSIGDALFVDMGSTTTDLIPIVSEKIVASGYRDFERLAAGELVYTGAVRTSLMAVASRVPFIGASTPLMNEHFASIADVYRILGELPPDADLHPTADGLEKTVPASLRRLARMVGADVGDADEAEWRRLASFFAEAQLDALEAAARQVLSTARLSEDAPIVIAGAGSFILEKLGHRLGRTVRRWETYIPMDAGIARAVSDCAPAVAVGLLLAAGQRSPS